MSKRITPNTLLSDPEITAIPWSQAGLLLLGALAGANLALWLLPRWLPALWSDIAAQQAPWHLARSSAMIAYVLFWLSTALGLSITNRLARLWPGGPTAFDLHQYSSLFALAFATFHAIILLGDHYIGFTLSQLLIPFAAQSYKPVGVAWGQLAFYLGIIISFSFYIRTRIGHHVWRILHFGSFLVFILITLHGLLVGSDSATLWPLYVASGASILFLTLYRIFSSLSLRP